MIKECRGLVCVPLSHVRIGQLGLQLAHPPSSGDDRFKTAWRMSVDARRGITTGISPYDRAQTVKVLIDEKTVPEDLIKPGHMFPLEAQAGGALVRAGHTEAAVDFARLAGLYPAGVICEIINDDGTMARLPDLVRFAQKHDLKICTIAALIEYRRQKEKLVRRLETVTLPTEYGTFVLHLYESQIDGTNHIALVKGTLGDAPAIVRVHSECLTGDVFGSCRCDCGQQLDQSLRRIAESGGVLLYMRQEGRGIGLANKIKAYALQDKGRDTVEANHELGFNSDLRDYGIGAQILVDLGIKKLKLLTNNPRKIIGLEGYGLEIVERIPLRLEHCRDNEKYLTTKKEKLDHLL